MKKMFDLNIGTVLENWEIKDAIREFIANALDESVLSKTKMPEIYKEGSNWIIRDFGRGLKEKHFKQDENEEKANGVGIIGKFGVGIKDALAVLDRNKIEVVLKSKFLTARTVMEQKSGFEEISSLHVNITDPEDKEFVGTAVVITCDDEAMAKAKDQFMFSHEYVILGENKGGQLIKKENRKDKSYIFVNGMRVASEDNFLFHYNITELNAALKKGLSRERNNLGRSVYSDAVKRTIISNCTPEVKEILVSEIQNYRDSERTYEIREWKEIRKLAFEAAAEANPNTMFISKTQLETMSKDQKEELSEKGIVFQVADDKVLSELVTSGSTYTYTAITQKLQENFEPEPIMHSEFTRKQQDNFKLSGVILKMADFNANDIRDVLRNLKISKRLPVDLNKNEELKGYWNGEDVYVRLDQLGDIKNYTRALITASLHKIIGTNDEILEFHEAMAEKLVTIISNVIKQGKYLIW